MINDIEPSFSASESGCLCLVASVSVLYWAIAGSMEPTSFFENGRQVDGFALANAVRGKTPRPQAFTRGSLYFQPYLTPNTTGTAMVFGVRSGSYPASMS